MEPTNTEIMARLDSIERSLNVALAGQPDMTITAFAKRANVARSTVYDRITDKRIATRNGRIPASELSKVLS